MKKVKVLGAAAAVTVLFSCGGVGSLSGITQNGNGASTSAQTSSSGSVLGGILGAITNGETAGNVIAGIIGLDKLSANQLVGSWKYDGPGIAFTSENALAKASGQVGATQIEEKLKSQYAKLGFNSSNTTISFTEDGKFKAKILGRSWEGSCNTTISFTEDGKFKAKILGRSWEGSWTYDASNSKITMKGLILSVNGYVTRNGLSGINLVFEAKKLLTLLQVAASMSGNSAIETVGEISKSYDGLRVGFDLSK